MLTSKPIPGKGKESRTGLDQAGLLSEPGGEGVDTRTDWGPLLAWRKGTTSIEDFTLRRLKKEQRTVIMLEGPVTELFTCPRCPFRHCTHHSTEQVTAI